MEWSIADEPTGHLYCASGDGTAVLQLRFILEAQDFVYLRKGEWGVGEAVMPVVAWVQESGVNALIATGDAGVQILEWARNAEGWEATVAKIAGVAVLGSYTMDTVIACIDRNARRIGQAVSDLKAWLKSRSSGGSLGMPNKCQVICSTSDQKDALLFCAKAGAEVRYAEPSVTKPGLRYYVNEKRYCVFLALGDREYIGWYGEDGAMVQALRKCFEEEWATLGEPAQVV
jgi:hypothetical protein